MTKNVDLSDLINLKCIDDFNNKLGIILENNINGLLKILDIKYKIDIPQSNMFSNQVENKDNPEISSVIAPFDQS